MGIFEDYRNQDYPDGAWEDSPVNSRRLEDTLNQFRWMGDGYPAVVLELDEKGHYDIIDGYHRLNALQILDYDTVDAWVGRPVLSHNAESYPTCYLCAKPAKIEVMTAIGMRSFCGNECRGHYEGIDYGPDDYYISPKLEHDIELVSYYPGSISSPNRSATLSAKCRNCDFTTRNQSFYQHHLVKTLEEWDEDAEEWWDTGEKCRHDKMQYLDYLENGEDAWGNIIAGHIVIGCPTCGFKDTLSHVNIPQGCDNKGRMGNYIKMPR